MDLVCSNKLLLIALVSFFLVFRDEIVSEEMFGQIGSRLVTIGDVSINLCNYSCAATCDSPTAPEGAPCHCDRACLLYKDCCLDYFAYCLDNDAEVTTEMELTNPTSDFPVDDTAINLTTRNTPVTKQNEECCLEEEDKNDVNEISEGNQNTNEITGTVLQNAIEKGISSVYSPKLPTEIGMAAFMECRPLTSTTGKVRNWKTVTKCPQFLASHLEKWRELCENDHATLQHKILTLDGEIEGNFPHLLYNNPYCALCHGHLLNDTTLTTIAPEFLCENRTAEAQKTLEEDGMDQFVEYLIRHCVPVYDLSVLSKRLICPQFSYQHTCQDNSSLSTLCEIYADPKQYPFPARFYKNVHCALCNEKSPLPPVEMCTDEWPPKYTDDGLDDSNALPPFSLLMDFRGVRSVRYRRRAICPKGTLHDLAEDKCVTFQCGIGKAYVEGECVSLNISFSPLLRRADLNFSFVVLSDPVPDAAMLLRFILTGFNVHVQIDGNCSFLRSQYSVWSDHQLLGSNEACVHIVLDKTNHDMSYIQVEMMSKLLAERVGLFSSKFMFFNHRPLANSGCPIASSLVVRQVKITEDRKTNNVTMVTNDTGVIGGFAENPTKIVWEKEKSSVNFAPAAFVMFCEPLILTCDKILVKLGDYKEVMDQVKVSGYDKIIDAHEYIKIGNGNIIVCSSALPNVTVVLRKSSATEGILSVVGISLSMLGLAFTVATYTQFPVLRNVPGVGIMNLSVSLFFAQLLFEVAPKASGAEALCTLLGALQHYSWLVAFLWMNVLAYDTLCTFSNMMAKGPDQSTKSLKFRMFIGYAWGVPGAGVAVCLALNFAANVDFDYIDGDACWIKAGIPLLYTFGVPVALIIVLNVAFFTRTALLLRAAMETAKKAKPESDSSRYAVYIKLSSLMGFTWIFGFVAGLTDIDALSYLFTITNSVLGLYICISFALSERVRQMYKGKFGLNNNTNAKSSATATRPSTITKSTG